MILELTSRATQTDCHNRYHWYKLSIPSQNILYASDEEDNYYITTIRETFCINRESYDKVLEAFTLQNGGV